MTVNGVLDVFLLYMTSDDTEPVKSVTEPVPFEYAAEAEGGFLSAGAFDGRDDLQVTVCGNAERILLVARFDNLGKGASGAAIQNLNLLIGQDETAGLVL